MKVTTNMDERDRPYKSDVVKKDLYTVFSPDWLHKKAQETGLIKRKRKSDPST